MRIFLPQPVAHRAYVARNACCDVCFVTAFFVQDADGKSLLLAEVAMRVVITVEQRGRRRGRGRRSGCCSCSGRVAASMIASFAQMMSSTAIYCSRFATLLAVLLQMKSIPARTRSAQHTNTATHERASLCALHALVGASGTQSLTLSAR